MLCSYSDAQLLLHDQYPEFTSYDVTFQANPKIWIYENIIMFATNVLSNPTYLWLTPGVKAMLT